MLRHLEEPALARTEFYDDPAAPKPNSRVVAASSELETLPMHHTQRLRLRHFQEDRPTP